MAIYKNREVQVLGPSPQANSPSTINVSYVDGTHENVKLSQVHFTQAEKDLLMKTYPGQYDKVHIVKEDDVKAVKLGVAPSFDTAVHEQAKAKVHADKVSEISKKQVDAASAKAKADFEAQNTAPKV